MGSHIIVGLALDPYLSGVLPLMLVGMVVRMLASLLLVLVHAYLELVPMLSGAAPENGIQFQIKSGWPSPIEL